MRDHSAEPSIRVLAFLHRLGLPALAAAAIIAGPVLVLWVVAPLRIYAPPFWSKMVPLTAIVLLLAAASLTLSARTRPRSALWASWWVAVAVIALSSGTLVVYASGEYPELQSLLRLPAPQTSASLVLVGVSAALVGRKSSRWQLVADVCAVVLVGFVLFILAGYVFHVEQLVGPNPSNVTAPQTLLCLALLAFVIVARRAEEGGVLGVLIGSGIGSRILRIMLPMGLLLPFVMFGLIAYLDRSGILTANYARSVAAPLQALALLGIVAWMARYTNKLENQLRHQSITDELTGVFNRRGFNAVAEYAAHNAMRAKSGLMLFYFDLDGLKQTNDRHGHEVGSLLIKRFAALLSESFRKSDVVARVGGDEFIVLGTGDPEIVPDMLARLNEKVAKANKEDSLPSAISYSVGHSCLARQDNMPIDRLMAEADSVMYEQKRLKGKAA